LHSFETLLLNLVSAGRHLSHPGVQAVMEGAQQRLAALVGNK